MKFLNRLDFSYFVKFLIVYMLIASYSLNQTFADNDINKSTAWNTEIKMTLKK